MSKSDDPYQGILHFLAQHENLEIDGRPYHLQVDRLVPVKGGWLKRLVSVRVHFQVLPEHLPTDRPQEESLQALREKLFVAKPEPVASASYVIDGTKPFRNTPAHHYFLEFRVEESPQQMEDALRGFLEKAFIDEKQHESHVNKVGAEARAILKGVAPPLDEESPKAEVPHTVVFALSLGKPRLAQQDPSSQL